MNTESALNSLSALSHESRLAAFRQLVQAGSAGLPVGELRERLGIPAATLSAHLNILRAAGLVTDERQGRVIRIRADYAHMNALLAYLTENCCAGNSSCENASTC
jgi:ArsR family transcriptional regulator, arsenate/arsenite/antimonite-responsive transcriptional repressor